MLSTDDVLAIHALLADYGHVVDDHDWDRAHEVYAQVTTNCSGGTPRSGRGSSSTEALLGGRSRKPGPGDPVSS